MALGAALRFSFCRAALSVCFFRAAPLLATEPPLRAEGQPEILQAATLPGPLALSLQNPFSFRFAVNWELMRSGFNTLNVALEAEAFQETWTLEQDKFDQAYLSSPRARVPVIGIQTQGQGPAPFDTLVLSEAALAQLLGLQNQALIESEKWIFVELPVRDALPQTFVLTASPRYFISVTLNLSF